jgi:ATP-dependent Clp protease protease subunit
MSRSPTVLLPKGKDVRAVEVDAVLLQERIAFLGDEVNHETATDLVKQLLVLEKQDATAPITLYINSPGGSVVDGMGVYDTIRRLSCPVHAVVCGMAASMGAVILSGCAKGHRGILPHGEVLLHQPLGGARGSATEVKISAQRILKTKQTLLKILADNCGQPLEKMKDDCDRDYWLDGEEAVKYGICDYVL